jgi:hypothetical protein
MISALHSPAAPADDPASLDFLSYGNTALAIKARDAAASPKLPESFDAFNAKDFIEDVYGRATQI